MSKLKKCFDHIAKVVHTNRLVIGISQISLSNKLGYKCGQFISNIERRKCSLPIEKICLFCQITGATTDEVIKALLYDEQMTITGAVYQDPPRKFVKIELNL